MKTETKNSERICQLLEINENLLYIGSTPEEFEDAIIGTTSDGNHVVYSYDLLVEEVMKWDKNPESAERNREDAIDYVDYNVMRSLDYCPEANRPIVIYPVVF